MLKYCILNAFQSYTHPISVVYLNRLSRILNNATFMSIDYQ